MNSTLFDCPDCEYQYAPGALSCLNCGRIFRVSQAGYARPRTSPVTWIVIFSTVSFAVFLTIGLILNATRKTFELGATENAVETAANRTAVETRRKFALDMQGTAHENSNKQTTDLIYTTEDYLEGSDTLVVTGSALMKKDCDLLANKDSGQTAASLGFNRVICRNRRLRSEWALPLEKTNF